MKSSFAYEVDIYVGMKEIATDKIFSYEDLDKLLQEECDSGLCVSVFPCKYIYKDGNEIGAIVRLINYPRFPKLKVEILNRAMQIARKIKREFKQLRMSISDGADIFMLEECDD
jgi:hypothetical protein